MSVISTKVIIFLRQFFLQQKLFLNGLGLSDVSLDDQVNLGKIRLGLLRKARLPRLGKLFVMASSGLMIN